MTVMKMETSVLGRLDRTAQRYKDKIIFKDNSTALTFGEFDALTKSVGTYLGGIAQSGTPIAVMSGRHVLTPALFLGIVRAGCFYAPVDGDMPPDRLNKTLSVADAPIMLVDRAHLEKARSLSFGGKIIIAEDILGTPADEELLSERAASLIPTSPLYVIFTSGSTGTPKGVITSHLSLMTYIDAVAEVLSIDDSDILGNQSPLDYIAAIRDIYLPISFGACTYIIPKNEFAIPTALFDTLNRERITALCWSVAGVELPAKLGAFDTGKPEYLRKLCFSGSVINPAYLMVWQDALPDILYVNQYGPTEATASCTYYVVSGKVSEGEALPIGKPYRNYKIILLSEDDAETPTGEIGQICVGGPAVTLGYYGNPELTAKSFVQNPLNPNYRELIYKTGDLGRLREDGVLEFHGRMDRQIKHLGHRVELGEIENFAGNIDGVGECCALYQKERELLWLFYTGTAASRDIVLRFRADMPAFMVPRKLIKLDEMPVLPNGKTDMQTLKNYFK